jgi:hypothetical protein
MIPKSVQRFSDQIMRSKERMIPNAIMRRKKD